MWQCGHRHPLPWHPEAECRNHEVQSGWGHCWNYQKSRCSWPNDKEIHKPFQEIAILAQAACVDLHVTNWMTTQQEDPTLKTAIEWISGQKVQDLKHWLGDNANTEEGKSILWYWKKLTLYQGALYHCLTPTGKLEEVLQSVVPKAHWIVAINGCHHDAGH